MVKNLPAMLETQVQSLGQGRSPGGGHGNPPQYSCLENPRDRGAWWATVHGVTKSQTRQWLPLTHLQLSWSLLWVTEAPSFKHLWATLWNTPENCLLKGQVEETIGRTQCFWILPPDLKSLTLLGLCMCSGIVARNGSSALELRSKTRVKSKGLWMEMLSDLVCAKLGPQQWPVQRIWRIWLIRGLSSSSRF